MKGHIRLFKGWIDVQYDVSPGGMFAIMIFALALVQLADGLGWFA